MKIKIPYKYRLFSYFVFIFVLFTVSVVMLQRNEEEKYRIELLKSQLNNYANLVNNYMLENDITLDSINQITSISNSLPANIRISIINKEGQVLYDRDFPHNIEQMENHLNRPEIQSAKRRDFGWNIRTSNSVHKPFFYFAHYYKNQYYIRIALLYTHHTEALLKADNYFLYIILILFVGILASLYFVSTRFGKSISQLKQFSVDVRNRKPIDDEISFPNDELGDIAKELALIFNEQAKINKALEREKEKMIQHLKYATEGLAIFDRKGRKIYANTHFYQLINIITDKTTFKTKDLFKISDFTPLKQFIEQKGEVAGFKSIQINKNGKHILVNVGLFDDNSYEIRLSDITKMEKTRVLKQQMTSNIAHELRTPTTCLRGYLETLNESRNISADKQKEFILKAYKQSERLTQLIEDVSLLSNISETPDKYNYEKIDLKEILNNIKNEFQSQLIQANIKFKPLTEKIEVKGNSGLLYSVFSNLVDNTIKYAGENTEIHIKHLQTTNNHIYLSYYDTGVGIEESHLSRIFERFYRTNKGRSRNNGGSGLGLSIVYNIIQMHKGDIQVKNRKEGGVEYHIRLPKTIE